MVEFEGTIEFDDYWIGAILHDVGKLIQGLFFWDFFEIILDNMQGSGAVAEKEVKEGEEAAKEGAVPTATGMLSFREAENKLGMGYIEGEPSKYDEQALETFGLDEAKLTKLKETLNEFIVPEIKAMVGKCL